MAKYFSDSEFRCKHCGSLPARGIDLKLLEVLDEARERIDKPIYITSGYRCPTHNANIGGAAQSYHMTGMAADTYFDGSIYALKDMYKKIMLEKGYQGGLQEYVDGEFVHIDIRGYWAEWC